MRYRLLGITGIAVSEVGFGCWGIGGVTEGATSYGPTDDRESTRALKSAFEFGVNFYDTANIYGNGNSEKLIGETFHNVRDRVVIATKAGFVVHGRQNFSPKWIQESLENSLRRLRTDYVDLFQLHSPAIDKVDLNFVYDKLWKLKNHGLTRALGISVKSPKDGLIVLKHGGFDSIQVNLSMIDQRAIDVELFEEAKKRGVGIIARTPFNFGFLTDKGITMNLNFCPQDHRSSWSMKQRRAWQKAAQLFLEISINQKISLAQLALRFCLDTEGVSTIIPGMISVDDVLINTDAGKLQPLSRETMSVIRQIYNDNDRFFVKPS